MNDEERALQDKILKNPEKRIKAAKIQQEICKEVFSHGTGLEVHGYDPILLAADLMCMNTHNANKAFWKVLHANGIDWDYDKDYRFSHDVYHLASNYKNQDPNLPKKPYGEKAKRFRQVAGIFASLADAFDIVDKWADGIEDGKDL